MPFLICVTHFFNKAVHRADEEKVANRWVASGEEKEPEKKSYTNSRFKSS